MDNLPEKILIGQFGGQPVYYIPDLDYLTCKNQACPLESLVTCMKNNIDRQVIPESSNNLLLQKINNTISIGCLEDSLENYKELYKKIREIKKRHTLTT